MNQLTHWLDASNIYGSDDHEAELLRTKSGGKLEITIDGPSLDEAQDFLPKCNKHPDMENEIESCVEQPCGTDCFAAGL